MLKYLSKITMDILPSVVATIIGAYIVNHYIATKPAADAPVAAAASPAVPKKADTVRLAAGNIPEPGVKAKGISEEAMLEQTAAERPATAEKPPRSRCEKPRKNPLTGRRKPRASRRTPVTRRPARKGRRQGIPVAAPRRSRRAPSAAPTPPRRRSPRSRKNIATPTIWRVRRSNGCAATADLRRAPQEAARAPDAPRVASAPLRVRSRPAGPAASAADHGFDADRPTVDWRRDGIAARSTTPPLPRRSAPPDPAGRHSGAAPRRALDLRAEVVVWTRRGGTHQCRRRHAAGGEVGVPRGIAEIGSAGFPDQRPWQAAPLESLARLAADAGEAAARGFIPGTKVDGRAAI